MSILRAGYLRITIVTPNELFVDTSAWVAISIGPDLHHHNAVAAFKTIVRQNRSIVTTNLVMAETYESVRRIGGSRVALFVLRRASSTTRLLTVYSDIVLETQAEEILSRYEDQRFSFVDAVSFAVMRDRGIAEAFAFDHHFETAGFSLLPSPAI
jgi:uncharacterized protein